MNIRLPEGHAGDPLQERRNALATTAAILAADAIAPFEGAATVAYRSKGRTLVVGSAAAALPWADHLAGALPVTALLLDGEPGIEAGRDYPVLSARAVALAGWLGAFEARWQAPGQAAQGASFDLVLDLCPSPLIATHQPPHGYYAPGAIEAARRAAAAALLELVGDFEKPKYFNYKERLCAHSRNDQAGCNACVDVCSAKAISGAGDRIKVNPYLCAGCGACTTVCPTGALGYGFPPAAHTGGRIKAALRAYFDAGGEDPVLLLHSETGAPLIAVLQADGGVPGRVIPLALHHTASVGIDVWLAALGYGAAGISILTTGHEAPQYGVALAAQMDVARTVVEALGYAGPHFQLLRVSVPEELRLALQHAPRGEVPAERATFNLAQDKRNTLDYALDHLHRHAPQQTEEVALPAGAPFGAIAVNTQTCSLCMACVGACPASAVMDTPNLPQLRFVEQNCVQCGLCANTCPENAITLVPRMSFGPARKETRVLNESQPFHCIRCSKPFGTLHMVENMLSRLSGHSAFAGHLDRLRMCGDCRVIDMMQPEGEFAVPLTRTRGG